MKTDAKTLTTAVKAVETSKLDKTVADGKVQDAKTVKAVNDSKAAKEKADAKQ